MNLSKDFNTINYDFIIVHLRAYKFSHSALLNILHYLKNRSEIVSFISTFSTWKKSMHIWCPTRINIGCPTFWFIFKWKFLSPEHIFKLLRPWKCFPFLWLTPGRRSITSRSLKKIWKVSWKPYYSKSTQMSPHVRKIRKSIFIIFWREA